MFRQGVVIARKEILDHARESRSMVASAMHLLMGPVLVLMISFSGVAHADKKGGVVLGGMMSIFALVAAFVGSMNIAMDVVAGERERRSFLPLLLNPVSRAAVALGKWIAVSVFAVMGLAITLAAFLGVSMTVAPGNPLVTNAGLLYWGVCGLAPLALLAAGLQVAISTSCRTVKEAQTYLSLLIFVPMGIAMYLVFFPPVSSRWIGVLPIAGQQLMAQTGLGGHWSPVQAIGLAVVTLLATGATVIAAGKMLERDSIVYGS